MHWPRTECWGKQQGGLYIPRRQLCSVSGEDDVEQCDEVDVRHSLLHREEEGEELEGMENGKLLKQVRRLSRHFEALALLRARSCESSPHTLLSPPLRHRPLDQPRLGSTEPSRALDQSLSQDINACLCLKRADRTLRTTSKILVKSPEAFCPPAPLSTSTTTGVLFTHVLR